MGPWQLSQSSPTQTPSWFEGFSCIFRHLRWNAVDGAEASTAGDFLSQVILLDLGFFVKCSASPQGSLDFIMYRCLLPVGVHVLASVGVSSLQGISLLD